MHVIVESNFVLEIAFQQEEYIFCERICEGAKANAYSLHLPQYALTETFEKLRPLRNQREANQEYLLKQITQHRREAECDADAMDALSLALTNLLSERTQVQTRRLYATVGELAQLAAVILFTPVLVAEAYIKAQEHSLSPQDSLIYASVLAGLRTLPADSPKLFVSRNADDFNKSAIKAELHALGCEYLSNFKAAAGRLQAFAKSNLK